MEQLKQILNFFYIPSFNLGDAIEIFIIIFILYKIISNLKNTRAWLVLKGMFFLCGFYIISYLCAFDIIKLAFQSAITIFAIILVVVFEQDIKKFLEQIGNKNFKQSFIDLFKKNKSIDLKKMKDETINEIVTAVFAMSKVKTGALIVIEKDTPLNDIISTGISINSEISNALLINIFEHNTPLHDGAVIIKNDKIISATCYLPLSNNPTISKSLGTRHRAGIGVTESVDCFVIISSEETGKISYVENSKITRNVNAEQLTEAISKSQENKNADISFNPKKHFLNNNFKMKLFAGILGISLWFAGMAATDPLTTKTIEDIPIEILNEQVITELNKTYDLGDVKTIDVVVEDKRSVLDNIDKKDIKASIDLSKLSYVNTVDVNVEIDKNTTKIKEIKDNVIKVSLDDISYGEFPIEIQTEGKPVSGYSIKQIDLSHNNLTITGSETKIKKIDKIIALLNIDNVKDGDEIEITPTVYDKNGDIIDTSNLTFNVEKISAYIYLEKTKKIPLEIKVTDTENSAGQIKDISYEPSEITIAGTSEALSEMDSLNITLPVKIDISDNNNTKLTKVISLSDYIPENITLLDDEEKVTIQITYEPYNSKEITFKTNAIPLINSKENLQYEFITDSINIPIIAKDNILNSLENTDISLSVDTNNINLPGTYDIVIDITSKKNIIANNIKTQIVVTEKK